MAAGDPNLPPSLACPMADLFPDSQACRLHFVFGDHTLTDRDDIFVSQLTKEGKMDQLENFKRSFTVADITVDTARHLILVQKKGFLSSPEAGERWVSYVREKMNDVLGTITSKVVNTDARSREIQESLQSRHQPSPNGTLSCLLSSDHQSLLLLSGDAQEVEEAKQFAESELQCPDQPSMVSSPPRKAQDDAPLTWFESQNSLTHTPVTGKDPPKAAAPADPVTHLLLQGSLLLNMNLNSPPGSLMIDCESDTIDQSPNRETVVEQGQFSEVQKIANSDTNWLKRQDCVQLDPVLAMYLQGVRGQEEVDLLENQHDCRISVRSPWQRMIGKTTLPAGHEIRVCEGIMAAMDCHVILLPLSCGQDWSPLQKHILNRCFLASDVDEYANQVGPHPLPHTMTLPCKTGAVAQTGGLPCLLQNIEIMALHPGDSLTFTEDVEEACKEVFAKLRTAGLTSIVIPVPLSAEVSVARCLEALVPAIEDSVNQREDVCKVVLVFEAQSALDWRQVSFTLLDNLSSDVEFSPGCSKELGLLASTEPHVLISGRDQDITASLNQIQVLAVPEDFRRHAELLVKFLQDGPPLPHTKKMKSKNTHKNAVELCAQIPSTNLPTETDQKQTSSYQLLTTKDPMSTSYPCSSLDFEAHTKETSVTEQIEDIIGQDFLPPALCLPSQPKTEDDRSEFVTHSGIRVSVYKADVTRLRVDAVVNATDGHLVSSGGVARAIATAAGAVMTDEVQDYVRRQGPLKVTQVMTTSAGQLPCRQVLHTLGPRWDGYQDITLCRQHLADTVFQCLCHAADEGLTSVALPGISAGGFGVPPAVCAEQYLKAVQSFEEKRGGGNSSRSKLAHIHFVDIHQTLVTTVQQVFTAGWGQGKAHVSVVKPSAQQESPKPPPMKPTPRRRTIQPPVPFTSPSALGPTSPFMPLTTVAPRPASRPNQASKDFTTQGGTSVSVYVADISRLAVQAVVSATNKNLYQGTGVALAIAKAGGAALKREVEAYASSHREVKVGEVVVVSGGHLPYQRVLLAVGPRWADYQDKARCQRHLAGTVCKCLETADDQRLESLALPLISSGRFGVPGDICAESYMSGIEQFEQHRGQHCFLKYVHFVDVKEDKIRSLQGIFSKRWSRH